MSNAVQSVCVYCASSARADASFRHAALKLGKLLAEAEIRIVYGGGSVGSMGALADGALAAGGSVRGILPKFMQELEWGHPALSELEIVEDMRTRKHRMLEDSDAVIALPGGCGTFEELFEALTLKRLGIFTGPIILVNTNDYYQPLHTLLLAMIEQSFMDQRHLAMWQMVSRPEDVLPALAQAPAWSSAARKFAAVGREDGRASAS